MVSMILEDPQEKAYIQKTLRELTGYTQMMNSMKLQEKHFGDLVASLNSNLEKIVKKQDEIMQLFTMLVDDSTEEVEVGEQVSATS